MYEVLEKRIKLVKSYFDNNDLIKNIINKQVGVLNQILNDCKREDSTAIIEMFELKDQKYNAVKIIDNTVSDEIVYLIKPHCLESLNINDYKCEIIEYSIQKIEKYECCHENHDIHWFDEEFLENKDEFMATPISFCSMYDILDSEYFKHILDEYKVKEILQITNNLSI